MKKILIVASTISFIEKFNKEPIRLLTEEYECEVHIASNIDYLADTNAGLIQKYLEQLEECGIVIHNIPFARSPYDKDNILAYPELKQIVEREHYSLICCHTPVASILTRFIAKKNRIKRGTKVIYTAHGFHFYKGAPLKNWLLYYPVEKICSYFTDVLIIINQEDYALAKRKMKAKQIEYVPGVGLDTQKFANTQVDRAAKRRELGVPEDAMVLMSVGELNHNKNHEVVIKALAQLDQENLHYLIAGRGYLLEHLKSVAEELGVGDRVHFLEYRTDIAELYKISDICVFPSFREGLPVALMEAMACGLPAVCSDIRGNNDLIDEKGGILFEPTDIDACKSALEQLIENEELRKSMAERNAEKVQQYDFTVVNARMKQIYENVMEEGNVCSR